MTRSWSKAESAVELRMRKSKDSRTLAPKVWLVTPPQINGMTWSPIRLKWSFKIFEKKYGVLTMLFAAKYEVRVTLYIFKARSRSLLSPILASPWFCLSGAAIAYYGGTLSNINCRLCQDPFDIETCECLQENEFEQELGEHTRNNDRMTLQIAENAWDTRSIDTSCLA